jgi:hypothetical protein
LSTDAGTIIAFLHLAVFAKLRNMIRTGFQTIPATIALSGIDEDEAVCRPFSDGVDRAGGQASRLFTMHTRQGEKSPGDMRVSTRPGFQHLPPPYPGFDTTGTFTSQLTGTALNTPAGIEIKSVLSVH